MKIGIVLYSETGHTLEVGNHLKNTFENLGHQVNLDQIQVRNITTDKTLTHLPEVKGYDVLLFGTPVQGFSLPVPVQDYLKKVQFPKHQKLGVFITEYFKVAWLGGNNTMKQLLSAIAYSEPNLYGHGFVHWSSKKRHEQIDDTIKKLTNLEII